MNRDESAFPVQRTLEAAREAKTVSVKGSPAPPAQATKPSLQAPPAEDHDASNETPPLQSGDVVGRYVVLNILGSGGMGSVYAARDPELDRKIALKLLHHRNGQARLLREAKALARLSHPNIVTAHDVGTFEGRVFLAMEFVDGLTLRQWLGLRKRTWRDVVHVFSHAARGLASAHASRIVHRDFKPDNVLIGKDGRVRVLDFGLAGETGAWPPEDPSLDLPITHAMPQPGAAIMGTPAYMAPEQHFGLSTDARTDQFSFCVTLWEALFGSRPFQVSTLAALSPRTPPPAIPRPNEVPDWLARLVLRGLAFDPGARYPSMDSLVADIDAGLRGDAGTARILGRRYAAIPSPSSIGIDHAQRALDKLTGNIVTIVRVESTPAAKREEEGDDALDPHVSHMRTFESLTLLRHPHLLGVLDCGFDDEQRPYFVVDLREQAETLLQAARHKPEGLQINLLVQLLRALSFLHRRGVAHGPLTPDRVLVVGGQVKVLNLGLSPAEGDDAVVTQKSGIHPRAHPLSARGDGSIVDQDLQAFGAIARELFAKGPPSDANATPSSRSSDMDVDPRVAAVLARLDALDPAARFRDATEVIVALAEATGRVLPIETIETRESLLQAGRLVGRDGELARLRGVLRDAMTGRGSAWLIGGESGIGKSRLLEELRTMALVQGALVLRGQEESEGGSPYRSWRDALRWLALLTDLEELEASVLLPLVPDLAALLGRPIAPAPDLDGPSMHARLLGVVLRILQRQAQPVVLLMEDLQWARSDSMKLLQGISARASDLPLLIVASYRSDERPDLPRELSTMQPLPLARLSADAIAKLSVSLIGAAGERPNVLTLLRRETEGNAFFLVEVMRALAEEAGSLDRIGSDPLPARVFVGGMRRVIQRRLDRVKEENRPLLAAAAVIGRRIDVPLLAALAGDANVDAWAAQCIEATVVERQDGALRFAHDKLREALLGDLGADERRALHARVAEAIERVYPDAADRAASLAHHFGAAHNPEREAHYAALAGEQALQHGAFPEALALLKRALALKVSAGAPRPEIARIHSSLGTASFFLMDFGDALVHLSATCETVGHPVPRSQVGRVMALLFELWVQLLLRFLPARLTTASAKTRCDELLEVSRASARLSNVCIFRNDELGVLLFALRSVNLAERAGRSNPLSLGLVGFAAGCVRMDRVALGYFESMHMDDAPADELRNITTGTIAEVSYLLGVGRLAQADDVLRANLVLCKRIGDRANAAYSEYLLALAAYYRGSLDEARRRALGAQDSLGDSLERHGASFATFEAMLLCIDGQLDLAQARLRAVQSLFTPHDRLAEAIWFGVKAMVDVRRGDLASARAATESALGRVKTSRVVAASGAGLLGGAMETYLASWREALARGDDPTAMARQAQRILRFSRSWARVYPIGWPQTLLHEGQVEWLRGRKQQARDAWLKSLKLAQSMSLGLHQGLAHLELARSLRPGSPRRASHLAKARDRFAAAGATHYGKEAEALLAEESAASTTAR